MKNSRQCFNLFIALCLALGFLVSFSSCSSSKNLKYFSDLPDSTHIFLPPISKDERVIEYGDNLNIFITAEEKDAIAFFNAQGGSAGPGVNPEGSGFLVNSLGFIEFPIIGKIKVLGLTERKLKETLTQLIGKYVKDPLIDVRFNTFKITVLGEVRSPGTHVLSTQRTTIFEALGAAGDLSTNGKRYDIQLYRDYNGERAIIKIDLRKKEVLYNPEVFEMKHNDVIYVQPLRSNVVREDVTFYASFLSILIGVISIGFTIFNNN